jgi:hypothetical protein
MLLKQFTKDRGVVMINRERVVRRFLKDIWIACYRWSLRQPGVTLSTIILALEEWIEFLKKEQRKIAKKKEERG